jgi:hypothetical protein
LIKGLYTHTTGHGNNLMGPIELASPKFCGKGTAPERPVKDIEPAVT